MREGCPAREAFFNSHRVHTMLGSRSEGADGERRSVPSLPRTRAPCAMPTRSLKMQAVDKHSAVPFAPGESPFKVKGSICRGCADYVAENVRGGLPAVLAALPNDALRQCLDTPFLASVWYDAFVLNALLLSAAKVQGLSFEAFLNQAFEAQAARDQRGVYKMLLRAISPEMLVKRLPSIGSQLFSFTRSEVSQLGPGHWHNTISGIPEALRTVYCESSGAFVSRALRTTGAADLQHRWLAPRPATPPTAHGVPICTVVRELRWTTS